MSDSPINLKRVPKWAWIASGGVAIGVVVMKSRLLPGTRVNTTADENATGPAEVGGTGGLVYDSYGLPVQQAGGFSGVIVPPVIQSGGEGTQQVSTLGDVLGGLTDLIAVLGVTATGGGPPVVAPAAPSPIVAVPAPAPPANPCTNPAFPYWDAGKGDCWRQSFESRTKDGNCIRVECRTHSGGSKWCSSVGTLIHKGKCK